MLKAWDGMEEVLAEAWRTQKKLNLSSLSGTELSSIILPASDSVRFSIPCSIVGPDIIIREKTTNFIDFPYATHFSLIEILQNFLFVDGGAKIRIPGHNKTLKMASAGLCCIALSI